MDILLRHFLKSDNGFRYEQKFEIYERSPQEVQYFLRIHPCVFSEIYPPRFIQNIYFDTPGLRLYYDHVHGRTQRAKVRIRWYGESQDEIQNAFLEFKLREGSFGYKLRYPLESLSLKPLFSSRDLRSVLRRAQIPPSLIQFVSELEGIIMNRYERRYYLSFDGKFRATLDTHLGFARMESHPFALTEYAAAAENILEIKYDALHHETAHTVTNLLPFRLCRHSKYVRGIEQLSEEMRGVAV